MSRPKSLSGSLIRASRGPYSGGEVSAFSARRLRGFFDAEQLFAGRSDRCSFPFLRVIVSQTLRHERRHDAAARLARNLCVGLKGHQVDPTGPSVAQPVTRRPVRAAARGIVRAIRMVRVGCIGILLICRARFGGAVCGTAAVSQLACGRVGAAFSRRVCHDSQESKAHAERRASPRLPARAQVLDAGPTVARHRVVRSTRCHARRARAKSGWRTGL